MAYPKAPCQFNPLLDALEELDDDFYQKFKLYVRDRSLLGEYGIIKRSKLYTSDNTDDRPKVLTAMMDAYGIFTISVMKKVLKALHQNEILKDLSQYPYDPEEILAAYKEDLRSKLETKFQSLVECLSKKGYEMPFNDGSSELYITEVDTEHVIESEHELRQLERYSNASVQERIIRCQDIFKGTTKTDDPVRTAVLTKGVAGIGKTVLTQKFSLDWAEGRFNSDIQLLVPFTFRELNVLRGKEYSLVGLLHHFFKKSEKIFSFQYLQVLFIFDGLDECRLPLDFSQTKVLTDPSESASVEVLLVSLIRGELLPSACLWITTRPAAAYRIPNQYVSMVTEVRGFTDEQKEQYFMKRFRDELQVTAVISHIKKIHSLYMMSFIPIFSWILSTVFQKNLEQAENLELPKTLTDIYAHFLVIQVQERNIRFRDPSGRDHDWAPETRKMVKALAQLAYEQLQKKNLIFYKSDLNECKLDPTEIDRYCRVFTDVFREEQGLHEGKVYCFIHLSVQEFLAALHVHQTFSSGEKSPETFYCSTVDQTIQSPNRHLDLFLRFLLGLSLPTNQRRLHGLLTEKRSDQTNQETIKFIKQKLNEEALCVERCLNLLHFLNELNDDGLVQQIQQFVRERGPSKLSSHAQWPALSSLILSSDSDLEDFDLRKYSSTEEALLGLLPVVKASTRAILSNCELSPLSCGPLASVLSSSSLTLLDLSDNDLRDSGVELLCEGLKSASCRLETLRLSGCLISQEGGTYLESALSSASCHVKKLDLRYNHPGASAERLTALLSPRGPLQILRLDYDEERWMVPGLRKYYWDLTLDPNTAHRKLAVSEDKRRVGIGKVWEAVDHEDRFTYFGQVLCSSGLSGRRYWEVEWRGRRLAIAVSYRGISRSEIDGRFGQNDHSWSLSIIEGEYYFEHKEVKMPGPPSVVRAGAVGVFSGVVGVFLDSEAGVLSFYEVSAYGELFHLHTFSCSFTEPLFPGFGLSTHCGLPSAAVSLLKV